MNQKIFSYLLVIFMISAQINNASWHPIEPALKAVDLVLRHKDGSTPDWWDGDTGKGGIRASMPGIVTTGAFVTLAVQYYRLHKKTSQQQTPSSPQTQSPQERQDPAAEDDLTALINQSFKPDPHNPDRIISKNPYLRRSDFIAILCRILAGGYSADGHTPNNPLLRKKDQHGYSSEGEWIHDPWVRLSFVQGLVESGIQKAVQKEMEKMNLNRNPSGRSSSAPVPNRIRLETAHSQSKEHPTIAHRASAAADSGDDQGD